MSIDLTLYKLNIGENKFQPPSNNKKIAFGIMTDGFMNQYNKINKLLLIWLFLILLYPILAKSLNVKYICQYKAKYHKECISCGLTRGFGACLKGDFEKAQSYNIHSTFLFFTIISQILLRVIIFFLLPSKRVMFADIVISSTPIIIFLFQLSNKW